jgi:putative membrane protein
MKIYLPTLNAILNSTSAVLLLAGFVFIKRKNITAHKICMGMAFLTSVLFLTSYLYHHYHAGSTKFLGIGWIRIVYFSILISHTILAVVIVPLILVSLFRAWSGRYEAHKRIARLTWPLWMYVSVTGVVIYWMLYRLQ